ncbi:MAG: C-GCAxxG-C-C family protein [Prolixibacteraceae bacterium]
MDNQEKAIKNFKTMNCNQSVLVVYGPQYGVSEELSFTLGLSFGGGMGRQGKTCGAVTGAYMVIGLWSAKQSENKSEQKRIATAKVQEFNQMFEKLHGSLECKALLNYDISKPDEAAKVNAQGLFDTICPGLVGNSTILLDKILL